MAGSWTIAPVALDEVARLASELGVSETLAAVLVRRGFGDPGDARAFLEPEGVCHDPLLLGDMEAAVSRLRQALERGERICVHGDYDVDGICATALAVLTLRELGADVRWHLPSRFEEGYGVSRATIARLADEGVDLVLTVDCGITAVAEVADAAARGLDVIVSDHHRPGDNLPACPIVATRPSAYPFPELCGTGVVHKLAQALLGPGHAALARHLDLVALATIADVVPLVDENRALATAGLRTLARTQKPGLQALMRAARVDPATIDATAVGFRLAPRINAAGRLGRPDVALHLVLTDDRREADLLAAELETLNRDRQAVEDRILRQAIAQVESWPDEKRRQRGYVLWGEDWHEGVIGIVASRLVERFGRPIVMIAGGGEEWKGSGRSISRFDLHGALAACAGLLERFGGHRAAAGLSIRPEQVGPFAEAFSAHADAELADADLEPVTRVDAVVPASALTLDLARELDRLAPFGLGNPDVMLLVASCEAVDAATVGEGRHLRFRVRQHGRDGGSAIAFGFGAQLDRIQGDARYDLAFRLKENRWNGTSAPQLVVRRVFDAPSAYEELRAWLASMWRAGEAAWTPEARRIFAELDLASAPGRRELLESETFRALLAHGAPLTLPRAA
ncbi:recJ: single-stranded-DNA-specific exonuclease RecJ [Gaiella occulta]|uniref:Single-stranded-DNA-specific exonuclease RecJ n=1 Tax=Gaiella occulta TaxID=1002870 RepID=A0A7M2YXR4_9ACTN|nr:single-stranded-DNA-specific exonuclease RecJ [Gaiella occulta]RDI74936.1 recJ: single-stranded-DNA-specific exonuclease RecJ [Gaiella occulta]